MLKIRPRKFHCFRTRQFSPHSGHWRILATLFLFVGVGGEARSQNNARTATKFYPDFSDTADAQLRNAAGLVRDKQWAEAVDIYQRVIQQFGEKVAKLPKDDPAGDPSGDSVLYVDLRQFCQRKIAALPAEAREVNRSRVDVQAERWFRQGVSGRDRTALRRVIDQAFCSSWGDEALELLADLAFQDGRFGEALASYRQIVPDKPGDATNLVHPDPSVDIARVAAKKLLSRAALGENPPADSDVDAFAKAYPDAKGSLAGREGLYAETLVEALKLDHLAPPSQPDGRWPTFAGAPTRTRVVPGSVDVGSVQWHVELQSVSFGVRRGYGRGIAPMTNSGRPDRLLAFHPIVLGDQVIVCDDDEILAYNLNDRPDGSAGSAGSVKALWRFPEDRGANAPVAARPTSGVPRFTLTAFGDRVYARMGLTSASFPGRFGGSPTGSQTYLVAIDRAAEGKQIWTKPASDVMTPHKAGEAVSRSIGFEGSPVADARNVYVAMTDRREQTSTFVVCLDAESGATRWVRYLGAASSDVDNMFAMGGMGVMGSPSGSDFGHRLLTLDGPTLYYQTNLGAVVALDADSGSVRWVATYPRLDRFAGGGHERDLNPALVHDGLVIVAPDDAASIYAFEAASGRLVWKTDPLPEEVKLAHLLGVAKGRLVATGDRVLLFDVTNGKLLHHWPDSGQGFEGYGRGILAGDKIYWPTRTEIHVLDQLTGLRNDPPIKLQETYQQTGGNLAVGDGYLIVAQSDKLVVFCQNRRLIQRYREEIARAPDQAAPQFRLARAAEATGDDDLALASLKRTLEMVRPSENIDGMSLAEAALDHQFRLLLKIGEKARVDKNFNIAENRFHQAAAAARIDRDRLRARLAEAECQLDGGDAVKAVATFQAQLANDRLRTLMVATEESRRTIRADLLIADRLASIVHERGRAVYAGFDKEARKLFEEGKSAGDARRLDEVGRSFPAAEVVPDALLALAKLEESRHRPGEASRAYKRLFALATTDAYRARALIGLAKMLEDQALWVSARDVYVQALTRFARVNVEDEKLGTESPLGPRVLRRLEQPPFDRMAGDRAEPVLVLPLVRRWAKALDAPVRPISAEGVPPSPASSRIFLARGSDLLAVRAESGEIAWSVDLGGTPLWVAYLDDRVVVASESKIVALELLKGENLWTYSSADPSAPRRSPGPFAKPDPPGKPVAEPSGKLHGFRVLAGRVYFLRGDHELIALDGERGLVDWSFRPISGEINANLLVGSQSVVLQALRPNAIVVLEIGSGRRRAEYSQAENEEAWPRAPLPLDDDRIVVVADRRTVALFDLVKGVNAWVFHESKDLPKNGPPRLFGDAERLLMLHDGNELIRLDATTGLKKWSRPLGVEDLSERPEALALDGERAYWASGFTLNGLQLSDGSLAWSRHLSGRETGWAIELTERCVLAYPGLSKRTETGPAGLPLVLRRRDTGALVQRIFLSTLATEVAVRLSPGGAFVATQSGLWALGAREEDVVDVAGGDR